MFSLFFLLLSVVFGGITEGMIAVHPTYFQGHVCFEVVDSNNEKVTGLQVVASRDDDSSMNALYRNGAYEIDTELPSGISTFNLLVVGYFCI